MTHTPPRDHLLARGKWAQRASNFLGTSWSKGWLPEPVLDPEALWQIAAKPLGDRAEAAEHSGRNAEDVADFRLRLTKLVEAANAEADLNPLGRAMAHGQLVRVIRNRLKLGAAWIDDPELLQTELAPPIIVIGHMRSGTTRIHKLFAADPAHSHTRYCDAWHPAPGNLPLRWVKGTAELAILEKLNPWMQSIHPMASEEVEEELAWLAAALNHSIYESQWHIPSYSTWSEGRDPAPIYREMVRILRTDAALRGNAEKPRVMKAPQFSEDLATLLAQFPTARLVIAERDRDDVLRSAVSLAANQMAMQSDTCSVEAIEQIWAHKIALRERRVAVALESWDGPVVRLQFDALNTGWKREIRRAYAELGIELTSKAMAAMHEAMAASKRGAHRDHAAQLERISARG